jgi:hypothetical protein
MAEAPVNAIRIAWASPYVPFNVQAIGNDVVVTYVLHQGGSQFETDGPGLGFVDIFSSSGRLLQRLEHGDWLNAPRSWLELNRAHPLYFVIPGTQPCGPDPDCFRDGNFAARFLELQTY